MKGRINRRKAKSIEIKCLKKQLLKKTVKALPTYGSVFIGKKNVFVPYADQIEDIVSSETDKQPIRPKIRNKKSVQILSGILRSSGIDSLVDIGDAIIRKY